MSSATPASVHFFSSSTVRSGPEKTKVGPRTAVMKKGQVYTPSVTTVSTVYPKTCIIGICGYSSIRVESQIVLFATSQLAPSMKSPWM